MALNKTHLCYAYPYKNQTDTRKVMSNNKRLAIYYTGGTIGMKPTATGLAPATDLATLAAPVLQEFSDQLSYEWFVAEPLIDSSAVALSDWIKWLQWLDKQIHNHDGILILHGTDTMAYTANILAMARPQLHKPIILTGAQHPFSAENSDAGLNLRTALAAFTLPALQQTVIAFDGHLWPAIGSCKISTEKTAGFANPHFGSLAHWSAINGWTDTQFSDNFLQMIGSIPYQIDSAVRIHCFNLVPGANADMIAYSLTHNPPDGIILLSYGNGNTPDNPQLMHAIKQIGQNRIPVLNISQVIQGNSTSIYAQGHALRQAGVINAGKCNLETALALLTLAVSNHWSKEQIINVLRQYALI